MRGKEVAELRTLLSAEQERRVEAERRLAAHSVRASENNTALARNNLRLQEQLARLRGEADVLAHEAGCQRAAAAARERVTAQEIGHLQARLQRAATEQQALWKQLAAKQGIIDYLEGKVDDLQGRCRQPGVPAGGSDDVGAGTQEAGKQRQDWPVALLPASSGAGGSATAGSWEEAAAEEAEQGQEQGLRHKQHPLVKNGTLRPQPLDLSEEECSSDGSGGSCSAGAEVGDEEAAPHGWAGTTPVVLRKGKVRMAPPEAGAAWDGAVAAAPAAVAAGEEAASKASEQAPAAVAERACSGSPGAAAAAAAARTASPGHAAAAVGGVDASDATPVRQALVRQGSPEPAGTLLRASLRTRNGRVRYAEPSLRAKLRQGDAHTFGAEEAAAAATGAGAHRPRARTKPRPAFPAPAPRADGSAQLPPVAD